MQSENSFNNNNLLTDTKKYVELIDNSGLDKPFDGSKMFNHTSQLNKLGAGNSGLNS